MNKRFNELDIDDTLFILNYNKYLYIGPIDTIIRTKENLTFRIKCLSSCYVTGNAYETIPIKRSHQTKYKKLQQVFVTTNINKLKQYLSNLNEDVTKILDTIYKYEQKISRS